MGEPDPCDRPVDGAARLHSRGVAALQSREHGLFWLAPWLVFSALMGSSIVAAMVLMMMRGAANAAPATVMVSLVVVVVVVASLLAVGGYLRKPIPLKA